MAKLIVYFSRAGENYVSGTIKNLTIGNTEQIAYLIQKYTNAELFKIEPKFEYSMIYNECIEEAKRDQQINARPSLLSYPPTMKRYDTIYIGYPNYWGTMPMAVFTFLEHFDLSQKILYPFCTHEGSGLGSSIQDIQKICPNSVIRSPLSIHGCHIKKAESTIKKWCKNEKEK